VYDVIGTQNCNYDYNVRGCSTGDNSGRFVIIRVTLRFRGILRNFPDTTTISLNPHIKSEDIIAIQICLEQI